MWKRKEKASNQYLMSIYYMIFSQQKYEHTLFAQFIRATNSSNFPHGYRTKKGVKKEANVP